MEKDRSHKISFRAKALFAFAAFALRIASFIVLGLRLRIDPAVKEWKRSKRSFMILSAHPSVVDAVVMLTAAFPRYARFVVGAQQLYSGIQGKLLRALEVISKRQFTPDVAAVKEIMRAVRNGYVLGMMPEGRVSMDGTQNPIDSSTAKLIKKLGIPVAVLIPHGTYFVKPPYKSESINKGKISGDLKALLSEEDVKAMSDEEISDRLNEALKYNVNEDIRGKGYRYGSKRKPYMENVSRLFYRCPACGKMYTIKEKDNRLICESCGMEMGLSREMFFIREDETLPDNIAAWNKLQIDFEHAYWADPEASIRFKAKKSVMILGKDTGFTFAESKDGTLSLDHEGLHYEDSEEKIDVPLHLIPGVSADYEYGFITYYHEDVIRRFYLEDPRMAARFVNSLMVLKKLK